MGPTAAIFGREFELFMIEEYHFTTCPVEKLEESIQTGWGTLNKQAFDKETAWQQTNYAWGYPATAQSWHSQGYSSSGWRS